MGRKTWRKAADSLEIHLLLSKDTAGKAFRHTAETSAGVVSLSDGGKRSMTDTAAESELDSDLVTEFIAGMPEAYRAGHGRQAMIDHARLAITRGPAAVNVATFRTNRHDGLPVCVVADDRPALLSLISAALVASGLDVVRAEAYCRETPRGLEAVALFWLRAAGAGQ